MRRISCLLIVIALLVGMPSVAEICALDPVPAATLLVPYFQVNLSKLNKPKRTETATIILQNAEAAPALARVTLWTDLSVPTLAFDVFLTGYDVERIPIYEIFRGNLPPTPDLSTSCTPDGLVKKSDLKDAHQGKPVDAFNDRCAGQKFGGKVARGYITIDNVNACGNSFPSDKSYFESGGNGVASKNNQLIGWLQIDNRAKKYGELETLVHIEAGGGTGDNTFYGRYVGYDRSDGREPLGTTWGFHYDLGAGSGTEIEVWRDSGIDQEPFRCSRLGEEGWYPLDQTQVVAFDEQEDAVEICSDQDEPVYCFPAETGKYLFGSRDLAVPYAAGWTFLNLNSGSGLRQSWVSVRRKFSSGKRRGRSPAISFTSACGNDTPDNQENIP